jgi:hypothetical protein
MTEKFITKTYVISYTHEEKTLEYHLIKDENDNYGVKVCEYIDIEQVDSASSIFTNNEADAIKLIFIFAKNFVFPVSVADIIDDIRDDVRISSTTCT